MSNKQKAWLNSYNLMVRLRMTQQINYHLARLRANSATSKVVSPAQQATNVSHSIEQNTQQQPLVGLHQVEPERVKLLMEQTHRWIMRNTELIQLDIPQNFIRNKNSAGKLCPEKKDGESESTPIQADAWASLGTDPDGQRLMLAYMAQMPFGDQEAEQAAATLLGGRSEADQIGGQNAEKCSGIECDLLLLEALNAHRQSAGAGQRTGGAQANNWKSSEAAELGEAVPSSIWNKWRQQLIDLFQLNDNNPADLVGSGRIGPVAWAGNFLANMWPLLCVVALVVLAVQFALILYVCNSSKESSSTVDLRNSPSRAQQQQQQRRTSSGRWPTSSSGRRLAQLGDSIASSLRTHSAAEGAQQPESATAAAIV